MCVDTQENQGPFSERIGLSRITVNFYYFSVKNHNFIPGMSAHA